MTSKAITYYEWEADTALYIIQQTCTTRAEAAALACEFAKAWELYTPRAMADIIVRIYKMGALAQRDGYA